MQTAPFGYNIVLPASKYTFTKSIKCREWGGGALQVKIGYVTEHPEKKQLLLEKYWTPRKGEQEYERFYIKDPEDWISIKTNVEKLWPELAGAETEADIKKAVESLTTSNKLLDLLAKYPELLSRLPENVNLLNLPEEQKNAFVKFLETGQDIATKALNKLGEQRFEDLAQLLKILQNYKLATINSLVTHITSRLTFINTFEQVILDESSYERRGEDSVHNLLKNAIWIIDRNFTVLHSDVSWKNIILEVTKKEFEGDGSNQRPDFLCMTPRDNTDNKLILIEIKKPSVKLQMPMVMQLVAYKKILSKYTGTEIKDFQGYLIGSEIHESIQGVKVDGVTVKTYSDFIREARSFYEEYLNIVQEEGSF